MKRYKTIYFGILILILISTTGCADNKEATSKAGLGPLESVVFTGNQDGWIGQLENGTYVLQNSKEIGGIRYFYTSFEKGDGGKRTVSVDVRVGSSDGSGRAGLLYGYQESPKMYYMILASAAGAIEIYKRDKTGVNMTVSTSSKPKDGFFHLQIVEKGREVQVLASGKHVSSFQSQGTGTGALGIAAMGLGRFSFTNYQQANGKQKTQAQSKSSAPKNAMTKSKKIPSDMLRLKRFEVVDRQGFGKPVVAMRFLAPAEWKMEGGITWNVTTSCVLELVSTHVRVSEPNGRRAFEIFPKYVSKWIADPATNQMMSNTEPCRTAPPMSSAEFISKAFIPGFRTGARVLKTLSRPKVALAQREKVLAIEGEDIPRYHVNIRTDAVQARIAYPTDAGNAEEWVLATSTISSMPMMTPMGMQTMQQTTFMENVLGFKTPAGELDKNERLFATIIASFKINPAYEMAVRNTIIQVSQTKVAGQMEQIRAARARSRRLFRDWNASIDRRDKEWKQRMAASDKVNRQFTEAIRGTQTFHDPFDSDKSWELTNDYKYVWKTPTDEFIMTNDINFNPNEALNNDNWEKMQTVK